jgi:hypothetical protein
MNRLLSIAEDRALSVPPGHVVRTGLVDVFKVRFANRTRIAVGDFDRAFQKRLQLGVNHPFPCPNGAWEGETFVLLDGRHEWLATVALGHSHILVAWIEPSPVNERGPHDQDEPLAAHPRRGRPQASREVRRGAR